MHGSAMHGTYPDSLTSCLCFRVFRFSVASDFLNLLLARFHQVEIITVKHLIQGRNNEVWVGVEPSTLRPLAVVKMTLKTTAPRCRKASIAYQ